MWTEMGKRGETLQQRPVIPPCRDHPHSPFTKNMLATLSQLDPNLGADFVKKEQAVETNVKK